MIHKQSPLLLLPPVVSLFTLVICLILLLVPITFAEVITLTQDPITSFENGALLIDGIQSESYALSRPINAADNYIIIPLEKIYAIEKVILYWMTDSYTTDYSIQVSSDIVNWQQLSLIDSRVSKKDTHTRNILIHEITCASISGRYIRIAFPRKTEFHSFDDKVRLAEISICAVENKPLTLNTIKAEITSDTSALLSWQGNTPHTAQVIFSGEDNIVNETKLLLEERKHKSVILQHLTPGTTYYARIIANDNAGHIVESDIIPFTTTGNKPPVIQGFALNPTESGGVAIRWQANIPVTYEFCIWNNENSNHTCTQAHADFKTRGTFSMNGLNPNMQYTYRFIIYDKVGQAAIHEGTFETGLINVALHKPIIGTFSETFDTESPEGLDTAIARANDGNSSWLTGMATSGNIDEQEQFIQINLEQPIAIESVVVEWRQLAFSKQYDIYYSIDGTIWHPIGQNINAEYGVPTYSKTGDPIIIHTTDAHNYTAQYVRLVCPQGSRYYVKHPEWHFVQIMEFKIFSDLN